MFILPRRNRFVTCRPEKQLDSIRAYSNNDDGALSGCQFNRRAYTWPWECRPRRIPKTQSNTRTYGTPKSAYVYTYIRIHLCAVQCIRGHCRAPLSCPVVTNAFALMAPALPLNANDPGSLSHVFFTPSGPDHFHLILANFTAA